MIHIDKQKIERRLRSYRKFGFELIIHCPEKEQAKAMCDEYWTGDTLFHVMYGRYYDSLCFNLNTMKYGPVFHYEEEPGYLVVPFEEFQFHKESIVAQVCEKYNLNLKEV